MPSRIYSLIAILCLLTAGSVWSQDTRGTISGRVTDPSGAVIPGAKVVVTNAAMGTKTDTHHQCRRHLPRAGSSTPALTRSKSPSRASRRPSATLEVRVADRLDINIALEIGASEQQVTVTHGDSAAEHRERLPGHRGRCQARRRPAALLRQSVPADRPDRRRHLQRQRPPGSPVRAHPHRQLLHGRNARQPERHHHRRRARPRPPPTPTK